jgi:hypothetical protein
MTVTATRLDRLAVERNVDLRSDHHPPRSAHSDGRDRILAAAEVLIARGERDEFPTIVEICEQAATPPQALDAVFEHREELTAALFDSLAEGLARRARIASTTQRSWLGRVRAALTSLLAELEVRPPIARFLIVDSLTGGRSLLTRREAALDRLATALETDRPREEGDASCAPFGAHAVVAAAVAVLHARLVETRAPALLELRPSLMGLVVLPFLGVEASRTELSRSAASPPGISAGPLLPPAS